MLMVYECRCVLGKQHLWMWHYITCLFECFQHVLTRFSRAEQHSWVISSPSTSVHQLTRRGYHGCKLKGIVHFEIIFWYVLAYLKGIQDVGVFVSTVFSLLTFFSQTVVVCQSYNAKSMTRKYTLMASCPHVWKRIFLSPFWPSAVF